MASKPTSSFPMATRSRTAPRPTCCAWRRKVSRSAGSSPSRFPGGSTPKKLYSLLATDPAFNAFSLDKTQLFFGDERHRAARTTRTAISS